MAPKRGVALAVPPVGMSGLSGDAYVAMWTLCGAVPVGRLVGQFGLAANTAAAVIAATASRRFIVGAHQDAGSKGCLSGLAWRAANPKGIYTSGPILSFEKVISDSGRRAIGSTGR